MIQTEKPKNTQCKMACPARRGKSSLTCKADAGTFAVFYFAVLRFAVFLSPKSCNFEFGTLMPKVGKKVSKKVDI